MTTATGARLAKDSALYTLGIAVTRFANLLLLPLYLSLLSKEDYGALGVLEQLVQVLVMITMAGGMEALVKVATDVKNEGDAQEALQRRRRLMATMTTWMLIAGVSTSLLAAALWPWVGTWLGGIELAPLGALALSGVAGSAAFQSLSAHLQVEGKSEKHTLYAALRTVLNIVIAVPLLLFTELGVGALLLGTSLSYWIGALALFARGETRFGLAFDTALLRRVLTYGVPLMPHLAASIIFQATDKFMLAADETHGLEAVGVYSVGARIATSVMMLGLGMQRAWLPYFFAESARAQGDAGASGASGANGASGASWDRVRRLSFWSMAGMASAVAGLTLLSPEIVAIIAPPAYAGAVAVTAVLCLSTLFRTGAQVAGSVVLDSKSAYRIWLASVPAALINVALCWFTIPRYGALGAAWSTTIAMALNMLFTVALSRSVRAVPFRYGAIAVLMALVVAFVIGVGELPLVLRLPLCALVPLVAVLFDASFARERLGALVARARRSGGKAP